MASRKKKSSEQACDKCGDSLPLDAAHFDRKRESPTGFRSTCKTCRSEERTGARGISIPGTDGDKRVLDISRKFDDESLSTLELYASGAGTRVPHIAELFESMSEVFGGPRGIAKHTMATYLASSPGSERRLKILAMVTRLAISTTASGATTRRVEDMTDEELATFAQDSAMRLIASQSPTVLGDILRAGGIDASMIPAASGMKKVEAVVIEPPMQVGQPVSKHEEKQAERPERKVVTVVPESLTNTMLKDRVPDANDGIDDCPPPPNAPEIPGVQKAGIAGTCPITGDPVVRALQEANDASEL